VAIACACKDVERVRRAVVASLRHMKLLHLPHCGDRSEYSSRAAGAAPPSGRAALGQIPLQRAFRRWPMRAGRSSWRTGVARGCGRLAELAKAVAARAAGLARVPITAR